MSQIPKNLDMKAQETLALTERGLVFKLVLQHDINVQDKRETCCFIG